jgi:hypothetical protein
MCDNRTGDHPNDHGSCQHKPDVLRLQSALAQHSAGTNGDCMPNAP